MAIQTYTVFILFLVCALSAGEAYCAEILRFDEDIPQSSRQKIISFQEPTTHPAIAKADLNGDGLHEFILRPNECPEKTPCPYNILAETDTGMVSLGSIEGYNLLLGSEFTHGVRNLLIFKSSVNDFDYALYTWHPETSKYRMSQP